MEKWELYWYFINKGDINFFKRVSIGFVLPFWFTLCFLVKAILFIAVVISGIVIGLSKIWTSVFGMAAFVLTVLQICGQGVNFWKTEDISILVLQIIITLLVVFLPTLIFELIMRFICRIGVRIEDFNIFILNKLV